MSDGAWMGYCSALDGLRTVAVGLVVAIHSIEILVPSLTHRVLSGGFLGVDLFFVVSGFLITTLLMEEHRTTGRLALGRFYARRGLRLIPAVLVVLACHVVWAVVTGVPGGDETKSVAFVLLYVANWAFAAGHLVAPGLACGHWPSRSSSICYGRCCFCSSSGSFRPDGP